MNFNELVSAIGQTHPPPTGSCKSCESGPDHPELADRFLHIEFEQNGEDRAQYGRQLLKKLEQKLSCKGLNVTLFQRARTFYSVYPQFAKLAAQFCPLKQATLLPELEKDNATQICATLLPKFPKKTDKGNQEEVSAEKLLSSVSFAHFTELIKISDPPNGCTTKC